MDDLGLINIDIHVNKRKKAYCCFTIAKPHETPMITAFQHISISYRSQNRERKCIKIERKSYITAFVLCENYVTLQSKLKKSLCLSKNGYV